MINYVSCRDKHMKNTICLATLVLFFTSMVTGCSSSSTNQRTLKTYTKVNENSIEYKGVDYRITRHNNIISIQLLESYRQEVETYKHVAKDTSATAQSFRDHGAGGFLLAPFAVVVDVATLGKGGTDFQHQLIDTKIEDYDGPLKSGQINGYLQIYNQNQKVILARSIVSQLNKEPLTYHLPQDIEGCVFIKLESELMLPRGNELFEINNHRVC